MLAVHIARSITSILSVGALITSLAGCVSTFDRDLAFHHAPVHYQDTDNSDPVADYLTAVDYDGEWETKNNWDNLKTNSADLRARVYYSVVESCTHWFVVYGFYHPRDWTDTPFDQEHENDLEGVLAIIRRDGTEFGRLQGAITVFHNDFFSYVPSGSPLVDGSQDIDGTLHLQTVGSVSRFKTSQEAKGHGLKAWPAAGDFDGSTNQDGIIYFPVRSNAEVPSSGNDRNVNYELVDVFSGMWTFQMLDAQRTEA